VALAGLLATRKVLRKKRPRSSGWPSHGYRAKSTGILSASEQGEQKEASEAVILMRRVTDGPSLGAAVNIARAWKARQGVSAASSLPIIRDPPPQSPGPPPPEIGLHVKIARLWQTEPRGKIAGRHRRGSSVLEAVLPVAVTSGDRSAPKWRRRNPVCIGRDNGAADGAPGDGHSAGASAVNGENLRGADFAPTVRGCVRTEQPPAALVMPTP